MESYPTLKFRPSTINFSRPPPRPRPPGTHIFAQPLHPNSISKSTHDRNGSRQSTKNSLRAPSSDSTTDGTYGRKLSTRGSSAAEPGVSPSHFASYLRNKNPRSRLFSVIGALGEGCEKGHGSSGGEGEAGVSGRKSASGAERITFIK